MLTEVGDAIGEDAGTVYVSNGPGSSWIELCRICGVCNSNGVVVLHCPTPRLILRQMKYIWVV